MEQTLKKKRLNVSTPTNIEKINSLTTEVRMTRSRAKAIQANANFSNAGESNVHQNIGVKKPQQNSKRKPQKTLNELNEEKQIGISKVQDIHSRAKHTNVGESSKQAALSLVN